MKKLLFCLINVVLVSVVNAQKPNALSLSLGPAFATGPFASKDFLNETSGFATMGAAVSLAYTSMLSNKFGVVISAQGQYNPMDVDALESEFGKNFAGFSSWDFDNSSWKYGAVLIGGTGQFALDKKDACTLVLKAMAGVGFAKSPGMAGTSTSSTGIAAVEQNKASGTGFAYCGSAGIQYAISKSLFLTSALSYNGADKMPFKNVRTVTTVVQGTLGSSDYQAYQNVTTRDEQQTIRSVHLTVGAGIRF